MTDKSSRLLVLLYGIQMVLEAETDVMVAEVFP